MNELNCKCKVCGKQFEYGDENSPCLTDKKWKRVVNFYNLGLYEKKARKLYAKFDPWLDEDFVDKDEYHLYICSDCMEKALGRKIQHRSRFNHSPSKYPRRLRFRINNQHRN